MSSNYDTVVLATANLTNYYTLNSDGTDSKGSVNGVVTGGSFVTAGGCIDGSNCWTSTGVGVEQIVFASSQQPTSGDFAFEWGMKATANGQAEFIWVASPTTLQNGVYIRNTNEIDIRNAASPTSSGPNLTDSLWHHYVVSYTSGTIKWYQDGVLVTTTSATASQSSQATSAFLRRVSGLTMLMQKFAFYNAQLSSGTVTAHYAAYTTAPPAGGPFILNMDGNLTGNVNGGFLG